MQALVNRDTCDSRASRCRPAAPQFIAPWARRTPRLLHWLGPMALALGGRAGVRLSRRRGRAVSRPTLRRRVRRLPRPGGAAPPVLGLDAWASRTRQTAGTVRRDRQRRRALALVPAREAARAPAAVCEGTPRRR
jgi:hypothetical protein